MEDGDPNEQHTTPALRFVRLRVVLVRRQAHMRPSQVRRLQAASGRAMTTTADERAAIRADANKRLAELKAVQCALWPDRRDPTVRAELEAVESEILSAEAVLAVG
jgi:hypothetical protein